MAPFLLADARISEVTIGDLEDTGYTVDHGAADSFPQFGVGCRYGSKARITVTTPGQTTPQLSNQGMEYAVQMAQNLLKEMSDGESRVFSPSLEDKLMALEFNMMNSTFVRTMSSLLWR